VTLGNDSHGQVHSGFIVLSGRLIEASQIYSHELHNKLDDGYFMRDTSHRAAYSDSYGQGYLDFREEDKLHKYQKKGAELKALFVLANFYFREETDLHFGLPLPPVGRTSDPALQCRLRSISRKYQVKRREKLWMYMKERVLSTSYTVMGRIVV